MPTRRHCRAFIPGAIRKPHAFPGSREALPAVVPLSVRSSRDSHIHILHRQQVEVWHLDVECPRLQATRMADLKALQPDERGRYSFCCSTSRLFTQPWQTCMTAVFWSTIGATTLHGYGLSALSAWCWWSASHSIASRSASNTGWWTLTMTTLLC